MLQICNLHYLSQSQGWKTLEQKGVEKIHTVAKKISDPGKYFIL